MGSNKSKFKAILGMLFASLCLTLFLPSESFAQSKRAKINRGSRSNKAVTRNNRSLNTRRNNSSATSKRNNSRFGTNRNATTRTSKPRVRKNRNTTARRNNSGVRGNRNANTRFNRSRNFRNFKRRGTIVNRFPRRSSSIRFGSTNYWYNRGIFYRPFNGRYIVARAPIGIRISVLPRNPYRFFHYGRNYYYHFGTFYTPRHGYYEVVNAPVGAIVNYLPNGYETVQLNGHEYYHFDGIYYKSIVDYNGNVVYKVVRV